MSDSPSDSRPGPGRFALVVASSEYEEQTLRRLSAPPRDAQSLARVLEDPEIGGFEVTTLTNAPSFTVLERLEAFFDNRRREDLLLLYVSGHGVLNSDGNLFFATVNTRSDRLRSTSVSAGFVHEVMLNSRARQQVLVLDCCHSGAFARGMVAKRGSGVHTRERFEGRGRIVLTASDALQFAFEGDATGEEAGSLFTRTLVEGLRTGEADLDRDGFVSLQELYDYASDRLLDERAPQRPSMWCFDLQGSVHIARNPRALHAAPDGAEEPAAVEEAGARGAVAPAEPQAEAEGAPAGPEAEAEGAPAEAVVVEVESQAEKAGPEAEPDAAVTEPAASDFGPAYVGTLLPDGATSETTDETEVAIETLLPAGGDERAAPPERRDRDATPVPPKPSRRRAQVIAAASLLGVLGVVLIVFPREGVTAECDDLQIAYVHDDDVWVTHPDGAERQNVTDHPARDRQVTRPQRAGVRERPWPARRGVRAGHGHARGATGDQRRGTGGRFRPCLAPRR